MRISFKALCGQRTLTLVILAIGCLTAAAADDPKVDLKPGDLAPIFEAIDDHAQPWKSADVIGKKFVVIYFYPGDFTPGCIVQARSFRDDMNRLTANGIVVIGVSGDAVTTHQLFKKAQQLNFTLLADNGSRRACESVSC